MADDAEFDLGSLPIKELKKRCCGHHTESLRPVLKPAPVREALLSAGLGGVECAASAYLAPLFTTCGLVRTGFCDCREL